MTTKPLSEPLSFPLQKWTAVKLFLGTNHHPWLWDCHLCWVANSALRTEVEGSTKQKQNSSHPRQQQVSVCECKHTCEGSQHTWTESATLEAQISPQITAVCTHRTAAHSLLWPDPHLPAEPPHIWLGSHLQGSHIQPPCSKDLHPCLLLMPTPCWQRELEGVSCCSPRLEHGPEGSAKTPNYSTFPLSNISR